MPKPNVGNRYGKKGVPVDWEAIKAIWCAGGKTTKEIAAMFGCIQNTIETRACRERWGEVRDRVRNEKIAQQKRNGPARVPNVYATSSAPPSSASDKSEQTMIVPPMVHDVTQNRISVERSIAMRDNATFDRAMAIIDSGKFRERVIAVNEKALSVLEKQPPTNVGEVDRFAEALTKVERIGARTYGYDREAERPVINIGVLTPGSEYD
jgi:hypothetical protein